jgi:hypothetical protein
MFEYERPRFESGQVHTRKEETMGDFDYTVSENLATAWAEKYGNLKAKVDLGEKYPALYHPETVLQWTREAKEALKQYHFWMTEV